MTDYNAQRYLKPRRNKVRIKKPPFNWRKECQAWADMIQYLKQAWNKKDGEKS